MTSDALMKDSPFNAFATQLTLVALCNPDLQKLRGTFTTTAFEKELEALRLKKEQKQLLFDSVAFAKSFFKISGLPFTPPYKPVTPAILDRVAAAAESLVHDLLSFFPPVELGVVEDDGLRNLGPICGDFYLSPQAEHELRRIAGVARMSARIVRDRVNMPHLSFMRQATYLWPAFYIKSVTGKPHYEEVAALLTLAGMGEKNAQQLSASAKEVRERSPSVEQWLVKLLPKLPGEQ